MVSHARSIHRIVAAVVGIAELVEPKTKLRVVRDDPEDDRFLELAVDGRADLIVSAAAPEQRRLAHVRVDGVRNVVAS